MCVLFIYIYIICVYFYIYMCTACGLTSDWCTKPPIISRGRSRHVRYACSCVSTCSARPVRLYQRRMLSLWTVRSLDAILRAKLCVCGLSLIINVTCNSSSSSRRQVYNVRQPCTGDTHPTPWNRAVLKGVFTKVLVEQWPSCTNFFEWRKMQR